MGDPGLKTLSSLINSRKRFKPIVSWSRCFRNGNVERLKMDSFFLYIYFSTSTFIYHRTQILFESSILFTSLTLLTLPEGFTIYMYMDISLSLKQSKFPRLDLFGQFLYFN